MKKLSDQLEEDHNSGDSGMALEGYSSRARKLEDYIDRLEDEVKAIKQQQSECYREGKEQGYADGKAYEKNRMSELLGLTT